MSLTWTLRLTKAYYCTSIFLCILPLGIGGCIKEEDYRLCPLKLS